jgi:hypothetical protein
VATSTTHTITLDTVGINDLDAGFVNYHPSDPVVTGTNVDTHDTLIDALRWGESTGHGQSGYNLVDNTAYISVDGSTVAADHAFKIADFSHINEPINGTALDYTDLTITLDVVVNGQTQQVSFNAHLDHNETPNPAPDIITLEYQSQTVSISGGSYQIELLGFGTDADHIVHQITTAEEHTTTCGIWAEVTQLIAPVFDSTLDWQPGADGGHIMSISTVVNAVTISDSSVSLNDATDYDLTVTGEHGGKLEVNSATGEYLYKPPTSGDHTETFTFTVIDGDGDTTSATLSMLIDDPNTP